MAQTAGYKAKVAHSTTSGGTYTTIDGVKSVSVKRNRAELEISDFADNDGWKRFISGMAEITVDISGDRDTASTQQEALLTAILNGTTVFLRILPDGVAGFRGEFLVNSFDPSDAMDGTDQFSVSLRMTGAPTAV